MKTTLKAAATALMLATATLATRAKDIVEIAAGDERFSTLVAAVTAAGFADTL